MIARARAPGRFGHGGPCLSVTGVVHLQLMRAEHVIRGARLRGSINPGGGRGEFFTSTLSVHHPCLHHFHLRASRAPSSCVAFASSPRAPSPTGMAPPQSITVIDPLPWPRSTVLAARYMSLRMPASWRRTWTGSPRRGSSRRRRTGSPTRRSTTSSASSTSTSVASRRRRAASCVGCATTTAWSCTTSHRTRSRRRPCSSASARDSWRSQ
jgi:hypothetical protein